MPGSTYDLIISTVPAAKNTPLLDISTLILKVAVAATTIIISFCLGMFSVAILYVAILLRQRLRIASTTHAMKAKHDVSKNHIVTMLITPRMSITTIRTRRVIAVIIQPY